MKKTAKALTLAAGLAMAASGCTTNNYTQQGEPQVIRVREQVATDEFNRALGTEYVREAQDATRDFALSATEIAGLQSRVGASTNADPAREGRINARLDSLLERGYMAVPLGNQLVANVTSDGNIVVPGEIRGQQSPQVVVPYVLNGTEQSTTLPRGHTLGISKPQPLSAYGGIAPLNPSTESRALFSQVSLGVLENEANERVTVKVLVPGLAPRFRQAQMIALTGYEGVDFRVLADAYAAAASQPALRMNAQSRLEALLSRERFTSRSDADQNNAHYHLAGDLQGLSLNFTDRDASDSKVSFRYGVRALSDLAANANGARFGTVTIEYDTSGFKMTIEETMRHGDRADFTVSRVQENYRGSASSGRELVNYVVQRSGALHSEVPVNGTR